MRERNISDGELLDFCRKDESHFFDRKALAVSGRQIQKIAVAFANADGGEFVVGVKDKKESKVVRRRWEGVESREDLNHVIQALQETVPQVPHIVEWLIAEDGTLALRVMVEKSERVHEVASGDVYVRRGPQSMKLTAREDIQSLGYAKGESSYEDTVVSSARAEDIFESSEMAAFLDDLSPASDPIDFTINQNLVDRASFEPRTAGILLFSENPVPLLPRRCGIKISRYKTADDTPERDHLGEQVTIEGPLYSQIKDAAEAVSKILEGMKILTPTGMQSISYPPETLWEIIVNAVIHRDYSISDDIHILILDNRVEVISPGRLPGYVTVENILDSRFSRNSKIVRMLNKYADPPNKDMGEGLNTAFGRMEEFRLSPPEIHELATSVRVVIPHTPLASPEELVLEFLEKNETIRNAQGRGITGIKSENAMKRVFYKLRENGLIEPVYSEKGKKIIAWSKKK